MTSYVLPEEGKMELLKMFRIDLGQWAKANQYTAKPVRTDLTRTTLPPKESNL